MSSHVDISILVLGTSFSHSFESAAVDFVLPLSSTIWASDLIMTFCRGPLIEAGFVKVVSTSSLTPYNGLGLLRELLAADWTITFDGLTLAILIFSMDCLGGERTCMIKHVIQFRCQERCLVVQRLWGFEDFQQHIEDVFTLRIPVDSEVGTCTLWNVSDPDGVDVASAASQVDFFHRAMRLAVWAVVIIRASSVDHDHTLGRGSICDRGILLRCLLTNPVECKPCKGYWQYVCTHGLSRFSSPFCDLVLFGFLADDETASSSSSVKSTKFPASFAGP